jgi:hypothetical protein
VHHTARRPTTRALFKLDLLKLGVRSDADGLLALPSPLRGPMLGLLDALTPANNGPTASGGGGGGGSVAWWKREQGKGSVSAFGQLLQLLRVQPSGGALGGGGAAGGVIDYHVRERAAALATRLLVGTGLFEGNEWEALCWLQPLCAAQPPAPPPRQQGEGEEEGDGAGGAGAHAHAAAVEFLDGVVQHATQKKLALSDAIAEAMLACSPPPPPTTQPPLPSDEQEEAAATTDRALAIGPASAHLDDRHDGGGGGGGRGRFSVVVLGALGRLNSGATPSAAKWGAHALPSREYAVAVLAAILRSHSAPLPLCLTLLQQAQPTPDDDGGGGGGGAGRDGPPERNRLLSLAAARAHTALRLQRVASMGAADAPTPPALQAALVLASQRQRSHAEKKEEEEEASGSSSSSIDAAGVGVAQEGDVGAVFRPLACNQLLCAIQMELHALHEQEEEAGEKGDGGGTTLLSAAPRGWRAGRLEQLFCAAQRQLAQLKVEGGVEALQAGGSAGAPAVHADQVVAVTFARATAAAVEPAHRQVLLYQATSLALCACVDGGGGGGGGDTAHSFDWHAALCRELRRERAAWGSGPHPCSALVCVLRRWWRGPRLTSVIEALAVDSDAADAAADAMVVSGGSSR